MIYKGSGTIIKDHNGWYCNPHFFSAESGHNLVLKNNFKILKKGYNNNARKKNIAEALLIKGLKSSLDVQEKSVKSELLN